MPKALLILIILFFTASFTYAQDTNGINPDSTITSKNWTFHYQSTAIKQFHSAHHFKYAGAFSLDSNKEANLSLTATIFIGRRLWKNAAIFFAPEITGGSGFSATHGIAGFPNGEIYRVGSPAPVPFTSRVYFQQTFALKGSGYSQQEDAAMRLRGAIPDSRITVNIGKFCLADFFDDNTYNHDARSQFMNWSMMANGAWDFAADTRGYTSGLEIELIKPKYAIKFAFTQMPKQANAMKMDWDLLKTNAMALEFSTKYKLFAEPGVIRITGYRNSGRAPKYKDATQGLLRGDSTLASIINGSTLGTKFGGIKYGYGINIEQPVIKNIGAFARYGWNDGKTASWAFTDIDETIQLGINACGKLWGRPDDAFGLAVSSNGISKDFQAYLKAGGSGIIIGDGNLNYGREQVFETFYNARLCTNLSLSADYQLILNPAYNIDRKGPISIPGIRAHIEF